MYPEIPEDMHVSIARTMTKRSFSSVRPVSGFSHTGIFLQLNLKLTHQYLGIFLIKLQKPRFFELENAGFVEDLMQHIYLFFGVYI